MGNCQVQAWVQLKLPTGYLCNALDGITIIILNIIKLIQHTCIFLISFDIWVGVCVITLSTLQNKKFLNIFTSVLDKFLKFLADRICKNLLPAVAWSKGVFLQLACDLVICECGLPYCLGIQNMQNNH